MRKFFDYYFWPTGPGPAVYLLPTTIGYKGHDTTRYCNPAYSLRSRVPGAKPVIVPGPQYVYKDLNRFGPKNSPKHSIHPRVPPFSRFNNPGPGTYAPEKFDHLARNMISFGWRHKGPKRGPVPGPNQYMLPDMLGPDLKTKRSGPACYMGMRWPTRKPPQIPSPAEYPPPDLNKIRRRDPVPVFQGRLQDIKKYHSPAPNTYLTNYNVRRNPQQYSFGMRHCFNTMPYITKEDNVKY